MGKNILEALVDVSEKAANIARVFRQNEHLFELLVQEKPVGEANPRFVHDYKTLADVLIQETIRHDISTDVSIFAITLCIYGCDVGVMGGVSLARVLYRFIVM